MGNLSNINSYSKLNTCNKRTEKLKYIKTSASLCGVSSRNGCVHIQEHGEKSPIKRLELNLPDN